MPNATPNWDELFSSTYAAQLAATVDQSTSGWDFIFDSVTSGGTAVSSGPIEIPMRKMYGRIRLSAAVPKAKRCTYLDWTPTPGDRA